MGNINHPKFPCKICVKNVQDKDKAVQCDLCELWIHIKCNNLNYLDYRYLQNCDGTSLTMQHQKMVMTLKKLLLPNIMTLMKCITLKYLTKINPFPYSI